MKIIKDKKVVNDAWQVLRLHEGDAADSIVVPQGEYIVPLPVWNCQWETLRERKELGLWLGGLERAEDIPDDVNRFPVIAIDIHKYTDGRAYTLAYRLRKQYGYRCELRAMGDVLHDQLFYLKRMGFDSFAMRADQDLQRGVSGFDTFSVKYQASVDVATPLFNRIERGVA
ncbi:MAG: DUF934 domain-containing protein [Gammaproteobacteria bacterium]|nr:DUF934 domain-containing protein [Gammaproteobacteria bacterium]MBU1623880.1 DUF934 domain-containing protein [Gammaproteobacteria bacterium]MBU1982097.1 DUF934 domain-containing protein [Gammaproteobacteria bacterium]